MLVKERFKNKGLFAVLDDYVRLPFNKTVILNGKSFTVDINRETLDTLYFANSGCRVLNPDFINVSDTMLGSVLTNSLYVKWINIFNLLFNDYIDHVLNSDVTTIETENTDNKKTEINDNKLHKISAYNDVNLIDDGSDTVKVNSDVNNKSNLKTTINKKRSDNFKNVKSFILHDLNIDLYDIIFNDVNKILTEIIY
jgi:hypothetical protein